MTPNIDRRAYHWILGFALATMLPVVAFAQPLQSPTAYFGHPMGQDRTLVSYDDMLPYLRHLAEASDRVELRSIGSSTQGRDLVVLLMSSPRNLARAERHREIAGLLHDPSGLSRPEIDAVVAEGKTVMLVTLGIHASEIIATQTGLEWAYQLAAGNSPAARHLDDVILLLVPCANPDGQVMITDWYREHLGTAYEGSSLPWLYHPYAGHDNNRDWFMLNLAETRAINRLAYHEWLPQVVVDVHQMGHAGPRIFVPPYADPISDRVHPLVHRGNNLIGVDMALRLEQAGKSGVISSYYFDAYWPGGMRSTPWWKNTVGVLIEVASARVASPIHIDPGELSGGQKGLVDYQPQVNFPNPWPGGWWRPRDILEYELVALDSALETCARRREDFLRNRARIGQDALRPAEPGEPAAYVVPVDQHDPGTAAKLVELLRENGLEAFRTRMDHEQEGQFLPAGSAVFPVTQPMREFLHEMMSRQDFREVRTSHNGDEVLHPYDVTAWTLPLLTGVTVLALEEPLTTSLETLRGPVWSAPPLPDTEGAVLFALSPAYNDHYSAIFRLLAPGRTVRQVMEPSRSGVHSLAAGMFLVEATPAELAPILEDLCVNPIALDADPINAEGDPAAVRELRAPRVGLYQPWTPSIDEGWTRCVFDQFDIPYATLHNADLIAGDLRRDHDVIVLPDQDRSSLLRGHEAWNRQAQDPRPGPYDRGMGQEGVDAIREFVLEGGVLVTLGAAADLALRDLQIPVRNESPNSRQSDPSTPGVILRAEVDPFHPLGFGMPARTAVYHTESPVFVTELPGPGRSRTVVARFPRGGELILSGWQRDLEPLRRKAALVEAELGLGRVVLFGFRPQFRAQTHGTYRMLFNALLDAAGERP